MCVVKVGPSVVELSTVILENYNATAQVLTRNQLVMDVSRLHQLVGNSALHL